MTPVSDRGEPEDGTLPIAGRVRVKWRTAGESNLPAMFAELEVRDAETGECLTYVVDIAIRCSAAVHDGAALVELTELADTEGRPMRPGRQWLGTATTVTSTYLLAADERAAWALDFGQALAELRAGRRVARAGWNGEGQWLLLVPGSTITIEAGRPLGVAAPELIGQSALYAPHIDVRTVQGTIVPWSASLADMLARDWYVVGGEQPGGSG